MFTIIVNRFNEKLYQRLKLNGITGKIASNPNVPQISIVNISRQNNRGV